MWKATTAGETLYFFVHDNIGSRTTISVLAPDGGAHNIPFNSEQTRFSDWMSHIVTSHIVARLVRNAKALKDRTAEQESDPNNVRRAIEQYARDKLGLTELLIEIPELSRLVLLAAEAAGRSIPPAAAREVVDNWTAGNCYLCGQRLDPAATEGANQVTMDHLWPSALGGDSVVGNLAPACKDCNGRRSDMYSWPWGPVHNFFHRRKTMEDRFRAHFFVWGALHLGALMKCAIEKKITLKEAAVVVGPKNELTLIEEDDIAHYFNLTTCG